MPKQIRYNSDCPSQDILALIGSKWSMLLLCTCVTDLRAPVNSGAPRGRFGEDAHADAARTGTSRHRVAKRLGTVPPRVEYSLTPLGESLAGLVRQIEGWVESNYPRMTRTARTYESGDGHNPRTPSMLQAMGSPFASRSTQTGSKSQTGRSGPNHSPTCDAVTQHAINDADTQRSGPNASSTATQVSIPFLSHFQPRAAPAPGRQPARRAGAFRSMPPSVIELGGITRNRTRARRPSSTSMASRRARVAATIALSA